MYGFNIASASANVASTTRYTGYGQLTENGTEVGTSFAGDYLRNNQGTIDTFGWSANGLSFRGGGNGQLYGASVIELLGTEGGGAPTVQPGWASMWGVKIETMNDEGGSGSIEIIAADAQHSHTAESNALTPAIVSDESTHAHTADQATLTPHYVMLVNDATHGHTAEESSVTPGFTIVSNDATHSHTAETPNLLWAHTLAINDATHAHTAETPDLSLSVTISPNDSIHGHTSETPALVQHSIIHFDIGPNYIDNGDLESGDTDWVEGASLISGFDDVNWSLVNGKIRSLDNTSSDVIYNTQDTQGACDYTKSWRIRFLISDETVNFGVRANLYNSTYSGILSTSAYYNVNGWQERFIAPNEVGANFRLGFYRFSGHTGELDIDLISLHESDNRAVHTQTAEEPTLVVGSIPIDPDDATHSHTADEPGLVPGYTIAPNDCTHDHTADSPTVQSAYTIASDDTLHAHTADSLTIEQSSTLSPDDTLHTHTADEPTLIPVFDVSPEDCFHNHTADEGFVDPSSNAYPDDTYHVHTAGEPTLQVPAGLEIIIYLNSRILEDVELISTVRESINLDSITEDGNLRQDIYLVSKVRDSITLISINSEDIEIQNKFN